MGNNGVTFSAVMMWMFQQIDVVYQTASRRSNNMFDPYVITNQIDPVTICQVVSLLAARTSFSTSFQLYCVL